MIKTILKNMRRPFPFFNLFIPVLIKRGDNYSIINQFKFSDSAIYLFNDEDQYDTNKLFGFSFGLHRKNSVRFGWRPNKDLTKIEIGGHEYVDKLMIPILPICEVELNKWYNYELNYNGLLNQIEYTIWNNNETFSLIHPITLKYKYNIGYRLFLYFGGNKTAPHDVVIYKN